MNYILGASFPLFSGDNMARELTAYGFGQTNVVVGVGASLAVLIQPVSKEISMSMKFSGSSLEIFNADPGATVAPVCTPGTGYPVGTNEIVNSSGCPRFVLVATGATATVNMLFGLSQPG